MNTQRLVERLQRVAAGGGGWVLWLMMGLSVMSIAIMAERLVFFVRKRDNVDALTAKVLKALRAGDMDLVRKTLDASPSVEASVIRSSIDWLDRGPDAFREVVEAEMTKHRRELERGSTFLGTVGNNAPFIGLAGTVLGVIQAFQQLGNQSRESMANVMVGIAEALIATGVGLFVALPAVVAYNLVNKAAGDVEANVGFMTKYLLAHLHSQHGATAKRDAIAEPAAAARTNGSSEKRPSSNIELA